MHRKRNITRGISAFFTALILISLSSMVVSRGSARPPVDEFKTYHAFMNENLSHRDDYFGFAEYHISRKFLLQAYENWHFENSKFILLRDFSETRRLVLMALSMAEGLTDYSMNIK